MLAAVAGRFGFDGESWTVRRLERWFDRHALMIEEEKGAVARQLEAANRGKR